MHSSILESWEPGDEPVEGYRLVDFIGRGGFGEVWRVEAPGGLHKALKLVPIESTEAAKRCNELRGLEKVRSIRHPYLLTIERFELSDDYLLVIMELADRNMLDRFEECIRQGNYGIPRPELLKYMREAAEVLDLLNHKHGLQHLDIKPRNLFLSSNHVKVADFGLMRAQNASNSYSGLGLTPLYAPPELFAGRVEASADQYGLAVSYQEMLTGTRPYATADVRRLLFEHMNRPPDLSLLPEADQEIIGRAIDREPEKRFDNCLEMVQALLDATEDNGTESAPVPPAAQNDYSASFVPMKEGGGKPQVVARKPDAGKMRPPQPMAPPAGKAGFLPRKSSGGWAGRGKPAHKQSNDVTVKPGGPKNQIHAVFLAVLPPEALAKNLTHFCESMRVDVMKSVNEETLLRIGKPGLFGSYSKAYFVKVNICSHPTNREYRVIDVTLWNDSKKYQGAELHRRGMLLIRCLKSYLLVNEQDNDRFQDFSADQLHNELFA